MKYAAINVIYMVELKDRMLAPREYFMYGVLYGMIFTQGMHIFPIKNSNRMNYFKKAIGFDQSCLIKYSMSIEIKCTYG